MSTIVVFTFRVPEFVAPNQAIYFTRNPYQCGFCSWSSWFTLPVWFDCPQVNWSARQTLILRGTGSIPTGGHIFIFFRPANRPLSTRNNSTVTYILETRHALFPCWHALLARWIAIPNCSDLIPGCHIFLLQWFSTALRCAFFDHLADTLDTHERRGCLRWELFWTPNKKKRLVVWS